MTNVEVENTIETGREIKRDMDKAYELMETYIKGSNQYKFWRERFIARQGEFNGFKTALIAMGREDIANIL